MKKLSLITSSIIANGTLFLLNTPYAHADTTPITIQAPSQGINPNADVGGVLGRAIGIIFVIATLLVLFYLIMGGINWITSGGDKEKVGKARGMIINALIGLAVLALAFVLWNLVGRIVGVDTHNLLIQPLDPTKT